MSRIQQVAIATLLLIGALLAIGVAVYLATDKGVGSSTHGGLGESQSPSDTPGSQSGRSDVGGTGSSVARPDQAGDAVDESLSDVLRRSSNRVRQWLRLYVGSVQDSRQSLAGFIEYCRAEANTSDQEDYQQLEEMFGASPSLTAAMHHIEDMTDLNAMQAIEGAWTLDASQADNIDAAVAEVMARASSERAFAEEIGGATHFSQELELLDWHAVLKLFASYEWFDLFLVYRVDVAAARPVAARVVVEAESDQDAIGPLQTLFRHLNRELSETKELELEQLQVAVREALERLGGRVPVWSKRFDPLFETESDMLLSRAFTQMEQLLIDAVAEGETDLADAVAIVSEFAQINPEYESSVMITNLGLGIGLGKRRLLERTERRSEVEDGTALMDLIERYERATANMERIALAGAIRVLARDVEEPPAAASSRLVQIISSGFSDPPSDAFFVTMVWMSQLMSALAYCDMHGALRQVSDFAHRTSIYDAAPFAGLAHGVTEALEYSYRDREIPSDKKESMLQAIEAISSTVTRYCEADIRFVIALEPVVHFAAQRAHQQRIHAAISAAAQRIDGLELDDLAPETQGNVLTAIRAVREFVENE